MLHRAQKTVLLMGILNATPDSFSDGGRFVDQSKAVAHAQHMVSDGADILDVGGESTRPGAEPVPEGEERQRTIGLITRLAEMDAAPISIDTYKAPIAREAADAGAVLINDVWGMTRDLDMASVVAETASALVITYNRGKTDESISLVDDMRGFFHRAFKTAEEASIPKAFIWLDPGIGFSKTLEQNVEALRRIDVLLEFGCPVLVGVSRKSLIGLTLDRPVDKRLAGTLGAHLASIAAGASIIRAHDVREHADAIKMQALLSHD